MEPRKILPGREDGLILPSLQDMRQRLRTPRKPQVLGDHSLNPELHVPAPHKKAAVLILLLPGQENDFSVVFTQRTQHLSTHAGQVSFPGGRREDSDQDAAYTALREAQEEIGLDPASVTVIGGLENYITRSGYSVSPVIGYTEQTPAWKPDQNEVEHIFTVPLSYLSIPGHLAPKNCEDKRNYYTCTYEGFHIWGATAGILRNFIDAILEMEPACP
jgi:8-oxo-dGTP pyrophosphatase MutT (NUDIX family)